MRMIVMIICHFDDTNSSGGLDKQARLLAKTLRVRGENVVVAASTRTFSRARWTVVDGLPIRFFWTYHSPQISGRYLPAALIWAAQLWIWVILNRAKIALIHGQQIRIHAFVGALATKFLHIPSLLKSATGGSGADIRTIGTRKYFGAAGRRFVIKNTDCFIATTESIREDLSEYHVPEEKIVIIPNGLVLPEVKGSPIHAREKKALFLGRLDSDKNVLLLAKAAKEMLAASSLQLHFYGRGRQEAELRELTAGQAQIEVKGFTENTADILPHYGWLILPSSAEGLSNAMLEAMAHGVVPVVTKVSGCIDHIKDGVNGFFIASTAENDIAAALSHIQTITPERWQSVSEVARNYARAHFSIESVAAQYQTLYRKLEAKRT